MDTYLKNHAGEVIWPLLILTYIWGSFVEHLIRNNYEAMQAILCIFFKFWRDIQTWLLLTGCFHICSLGADTFINLELVICGTWLISKYINSLPPVMRLNSAFYGSDVSGTRHISKDVTQFGDNWFQPQKWLSAPMEEFFRKENIAVQNFQTI